MTERPSEAAWQHASDALEWLAEHPLCWQYVEPAEVTRVRLALDDLMRLAT